MSVLHATAFQIGSPAQGRVRALLLADHVYRRARQRRRFGVTALAVAGCVAWIDWRAVHAMRRVLLAGWLTALLFTALAAVAEIAARGRLQRAIEQTKR